MPQPVITAARTARLDLPFLFPGQAQKEAFVNEALARLDLLVQPSVIDERNEPPATPADGDCHLVGNAPTDDWSAHSGALAVWAGNQWLFGMPHEGMALFDRAAGCLARYSGAAGWTRVAAPDPVAGGAVQDSELRAAFAQLAAGLRSLGIFA